MTYYNKNASIHFDKYQEDIEEFAIYPEKGTSSKLELAYLALGLGGEAGEASEKIKKYLRDDVIDRALVAKELGDVLWYLTRLAQAIGYDLQEVASINVAKLKDRQERGKLQGNGDER